MRLKLPRGLVRAYNVDDQCTEVFMSARDLCCGGFTLHGVSFEVASAVCTYTYQRLILRSNREPVLSSGDMRESKFPAACLQILMWTIIALRYFCPPVDSRVKDSPCIVCRLGLRLPPAVAIGGARSHGEATGSMPLPSPATPPRAVHKPIIKSRPSYLLRTCSFTTALPPHRNTSKN